MKSLPLTRGLFAFVDDEDFEEQSKYKWQAMRTSSGNYYAIRTVAPSNQPRYWVYLHREIMRAPAGIEVHHKNGNGIDDRKENMEFRTHAQNLQGLRRKSRNSISKYRGVSWDSARQKWTAGIEIDEKRINLGRFLVEEDAARAYDKKATELFGSFAELNFPTQQASLLTARYLRPPVSTHWPDWTVEDFEIER